MPVDASILLGEPLEDGLALERLRVPVELLDQGVVPLLVGERLAFGVGAADVHGVANALAGLDELAVLAAHHHVSIGVDEHALGLRHVAPVAQRLPILQ